MKTLMRSLIKKAAYLAAALIVVAALLLVLAEALTPTLDKHKKDVEVFASDLLKAPVSINNIKLSWYGYQPEIRLNQVTASDPGTNQPIIQVKRVSIYLSILKSIWQMKLVPSVVMLSGSTVTVAQDEQGRFAIQGYPLTAGVDHQPFQAETSIAAMLGWLSGQPDIILDDIKVGYKQSNAVPRLISLYHLSFENNGDDHTILGRAILQQSQPVEITTAIQWEGKGSDLASINAKGYLYVTNFSLAQWLKDYVWNNWKIQTGMVDAKIWIDWHNGGFQKIQTDFQGVKVGLYSTQNNVLRQINRLSGEVGWKREGKNWIFAGDDILIDLPGHLWPVTNFYLSLSPDAANKLVPQMMNTGYLNLVDMESFLFSTPGFVPDNIKTILTRMQLKGNIQELSLLLPADITNWKAVTINAEVSDISFTSTNGLPGITNISGTIKWRDEQGEFQLNSQRMVFDYPDLFPASLRIDQLIGQGTFKYDQAHQDWRVIFPSVNVSNKDGAANVKGMIQFLPGKLPDVNLNANFTMQNASHATRYLPLKIFSPELGKWLSESFRSGEISDGRAQLRGNLSAFPFDRHNGVFLISANVKNVDLTFAPEWPVLKEVTAKLIFEGRRVLVDVAKGKTLDISFGHVTAEIPDLGADSPMLNINTDPVETDFSNALHYAHLSPLENSIGKMFHDVMLSGPITLGLGLKIPLNTPDKTNVSGTINIQDGLLKLEPWHLEISQLKGLVKFTESTTDASQVAGKLFNKPFDFSLATVKQNNIDTIRVNFNHHVVISDIEKWLKLPVSSVAKGETDVAGELDLAFDKPIHLRLHSQLVGVALDLPDQYGKAANVPINFNSELIIDAEQPLKIQASYGNLLNAAAVIDRNELGEMQLQGATLSFGTSQASWPPTNGLYLTGSFHALDWNMIKKYVDQSGSTSLPSDFLKEINVNVDSLSLFGQTLTNVKLDIKPDQSKWNIDVVSHEINGQFMVPLKMTRQSSIIIALRNLDIKLADNGVTGLDIDPAILPAISINSGNTKINGIQLGNLSANLTPKSGGLSINSLRLSNANMQLQASGSWLKQKKHDVTSLSGNLATTNTHAFLMSMGFDAHNFIAQNGKLRFDISWEEPPYSVAFAKMNGNASLNIGKGRIVDVGADSGAKMGLGRMLSLFSLQTIPRRLSLDFSDVFEKGYSFDSLTGDFKIDDGDIYTSNLKFDGPVAKIRINGRIGLSKKDYDLILSITPYVTSSIPVAATLLTGNPLIGLGALAVNTVVSSQVSKAASYYYAITGSWSNPDWKEVSGRR